VLLAIVLSGSGTQPKTPPSVTGGAVLRGSPTRLSQPEKVKRMLFSHRASAVVQIIVGRNHMDGAQLFSLLW
jgi:hypothetical protein